MAIYKCEICSYEFNEDRQKKKFSGLKKCPSCGAQKGCLKKTKDSYESVLDVLNKYRKDTPAGQFESED